MSRSNYEKFPTIPAAPGHENDCWRGWDAICTRIIQAATRLRQKQDRVIIAIECYSGLHESEIESALLKGLSPDHFHSMRPAWKSPEEIDQILAPSLGGDDPLFGRFTTLELCDFLDPSKRAALQNHIHQLRGTIIVFGTAALLCCNPDLIVYADMPRWEGQLRQRRNEVPNLGVDNQTLKGSLKYKRSFFIDWRVCDRLKAATIDRWDFLLDTTIPNDPKLITGEAMRQTLDTTTRHPFRVVPFFDPAPWGGQWMKTQFDLDPKESNYGWGFDCVPEENSLLLDFAGVHVEIPAMNLVLFRPLQLLGENVFNRFGAEFPIRFDFLDTVAGGNLSFQVHPTLEFARQHFGLAYTQDESYYLLHAEKGATVYLGVKNNINPDQMLRALQEADNGGEPFPAEHFVNQWPARTHDHFLIPAGTVHCSGAESVVLEISATPFIFTFKLWDWGRLGLDGTPRPTNISRSHSVIQWNRNRDWTSAQLINRIEPLEKGDGWRSERTGLHPLQFIETHRHWFTKCVPHHTHGTVNVLNLIKGDSAIVESPTNAFPPYEIHYAETFIIPATTGPYTVRPTRASNREIATIKAFVRT